MYELYALKVADGSLGSHVVFSDKHSGTSIVAFYFYCLKGNGHIILVDTGVSANFLERGDVFEKKGVTGASIREELLNQIDVCPDDVDTVIVSHLHLDHFVEPEIYSKAVFYLQRKEVEFWSGEIQGFHAMMAPVVDIVTLQKLNIQGRVKFLDGDCEIYPGVCTLRMGAHTPGQQLVSIQTARGTVLLCSDFYMMYRSLEHKIPAPRYLNLMEWTSGIEKIERMGLPKEALIPGHDPLVLTMFTKVAENVVKIA